MGEMRPTAMIRYSFLLTSTVPATPALTTLRAKLSIDKEVVIGSPCSVVAGFTVLKQTASCQGQEID